jgi:hypothetical protein
MIFWRISDSYLAATTAMEILVEENTNNVTIEMSEINVKYCLTHNRSSKPLKITFRN